MPHHRHVRRVAALALVLVLLACSGGDDATGSGLSRCQTDVTLSVSSGMTPQFTWTPACGAGALFVESVDGSDLWYVEPTVSAGIASGVTYGVVPPDAIEDAPALALEAGKTYFVYVAKGSGNSLALAGLKSFSPQEP